MVSKPESGEWEQAAGLLGDGWWVLMGLALGGS